MKAEKYPAPGETRLAAFVGLGDPGICNSMGWIASLSAAISDIQKFTGKLKKKKISFVDQVWFKVNKWKR